MLTLIEARNFRCLRYISQPLGSVRILVGPNASGKTTFLDTVKFVGDLVSQGLDYALEERTQDYRDLFWKRQGLAFELAVEARIPPEIAETTRIAAVARPVVRYEVKIGLDEATKRVGILAELAMLKPEAEEPHAQPELFPNPTIGETVQSILTLPGQRRIAHRRVLVKVTDGSDNYYPETEAAFKKRWVYNFRSGPLRSALGNLPADQNAFPITTWLKDLLTQGVQPFVLNSMSIRNASPPGKRRDFQQDGSHLPWVIWDLQTRAPDRYEQWLSHLRTALPDLVGIRTVERPDDRHRYIMMQYAVSSGEPIEVPSWVASDGTLRLMALTLPAYLPEQRGIHLIEEPENGVHPRGVETLFQSLTSVYGAQVLLATHSPVILGLADPGIVLCFAKNAEGATDIVSGDQHPALRHWQGETSLGELFAAGVLS